MDFSFKNQEEENYLYCDNIKHARVDCIRRRPLLLPKGFGLIFLVLLKDFLYFILYDIFCHLT